LERGLPVEVLPDRTAKTVSAWLLARPSIEIVSRDGSKEYAAAIREGAPQAIQVMDRLGSAKHLAEGLETLLAHCQDEIRQTGQAVPKLEEGQGGTVIPLPSSSQSKEEQLQQALRAERQSQYEQVVMLHKQGLNNREIAQRMRLSGRTIGRWLLQGHAPGEKPRRQRPRRIDAYQSYLKLRWEQGCHNGIQLYQELQAQGFQGSQNGVYRYLATLGPPTSLRRSRGPRPSAQAQAELHQPTSLEHFSARSATWLFLRKQDDLDEKEQEQLQKTLEASPRAQTAYQLVTAFMQMLREQTGGQLENWLESVRQSQLVEFEPFVTGIERDRAAVLAGLSLPWSNGPLEGQVNRLKLIKKSMYNRANFDLLRIRVLYQSKTSESERKKRTKSKQNAQASLPKRSGTSTNDPNSQHTTFGISEVA
jgi:transposase